MSKTIILYTSIITHRLSPSNMANDESLTRPHLSPGRPGWVGHGNNWMNSQGGPRMVNVGAQLGLTRHLDHPLTWPIRPIIHLAWLSPPALGSDLLSFSWPSSTSSMAVGNKWKQFTNIEPMMSNVQHNLLTSYKSSSPEVQGSSHASWHRLTSKTTPPCYINGRYIRVASPILIDGDDASPSLPL